MSRRDTVNSTGIPRVPGIPYHDAWCSYTCVNCGQRNYVLIGRELPTPTDAYLFMRWHCSNCHFIHSKESNLPFNSWPEGATDQASLHTQRFWQAFFRSATESPESYWKQCNVCSRVLPNADFSRHVNWGPLEKQMECRACKAVINAELNPLRTSEQLRESGMKRRIAELLVQTSDEKLDVAALFARFNNRCFKTGTVLNMYESSTWQIDHTLPSKYFYPLSVANATLLSTEANQNKSDSWPSQFYSNNELVKLAQITGANLALLSSRNPIFNSNIDVNLCVQKFLTVRNSSDLSKRISELKILLDRHELSHQLSQENLRILGFI